MPKISVLVPIYNVEMFLEQCLDSLIKQTFSDIEIICADDGSTDQSGLIADRYAEKDARIRVIHKKNTGYGNNMNVALDNATGDYVAILESDDFSEPYMIEKLYQAAVESGADVVKAEYFRHTKEGDEHSDRLVKFPQKQSFSVKEYPHLLDLADTIWSCLYRRGFLKENNIRFHETPGASYQDISFALQNWMYAQKVCCIPEAVLHYRMDNAGSSMNNPDKLYCVYEEYAWAREQLKEVLAREPELENYFVATKYRDYFNHYYRVGANYQYAFLERMEEEYKEDKSANRLFECAFLPLIWNNLVDMQENFNAFFKRTAKYLDDMRLKYCAFENEKIYWEAWLEQLKRYSQVIIYGAGMIGQKVAGRLLENGVTIGCFAVTAKNESDDLCMGISIKEISEVTLSKEDTALIIAVATKNQYDMYRNATEYGFSHVFRVDDIVKKWL